MSSVKLKLCLTTLDNLATAKQLARQLLQQKLVACVNISEKGLSLYHWQGEIVEEAEYLLLMKTNSQKIDALRDTVMALHPYQVAEFIVLDIESGAAPYLEWVNTSLS